MARLRIGCLSTDQFSFKDRIFSAFYSDLGLDIFDRVWDDSCDEGFNLQSAKTGKIVLVTISKDFYLNEELQGWELVPYQNDSFKKVIVWND